MILNTNLKVSGSHDTTESVTRQWFWAFHILLSATKLSNIWRNDHTNIVIIYEIMRYIPNINIGCKPFTWCPLFTNIASLTYMSHSGWSSVDIYYHRVALCVNRYRVNCSQMSFVMIHVPVQWAVSIIMYVRQQFMYKKMSNLHICMNFHFHVNHNHSGLAERQNSFVNSLRNNSLPIVSRGSSIVQPCSHNWTMTALQFIRFNYAIGPNNRLLFVYM